MLDRVQYEFAIIRVIPQVERGEMINVGVILYSKTKQFIGIKYHIDKKRLSAFSHEIDIEELASYLAAWEAICNGEKTGGQIGALEMPERFRWLTASKSTILQCSEVHPGLCHDPQAVVEDLFSKYVL